MIKRYDIRVCDEYSSCYPLVEDSEGDYVTHKDFKKATDCLMRIVNSETYISSTILKSDANRCLKELGFEFKEVFPVVKKEGYKNKDTEEMQRRRRDVLMQSRQNLKDYKNNNGKLK
jgi:hypothetical protein